MILIAALFRRGPSFSSRFCATIAAAVVAGFALTAVAPQTAQACAVTKLRKTEDRDYASLFLKTFGSDTGKRMTALLQEIAPGSSAKIDLILSRCAPASVMLNLSGKTFGPQNDQTAKDNFDKIWRGLQTKHSDLLCASDGWSGAVVGTLMKIESARKLSMEVEFIAHELNERLARSDENGLESKSNHPPTCAARGLEHGAKVAGT